MIEEEEPTNQSFFSNDDARTTTDRSLTSFPLSLLPLARSASSDKRKQCQLHVMWYQVELRPVVASIHESSYRNSSPGTRLAWLNSAWLAIHLAGLRELVACNSLGLATRLGLLVTRLDSDWLKLYSARLGLP